MTENEITNLKFGKWIVLFLGIPAMVALFITALILSVLRGASEAGFKQVKSAAALLREIAKSFNAVKTDGRSGNNLPD